MSVTRLPVAYRRPSSLNGREVWGQADHVTSLMVHEVCPYLRNLEACEACPEWETEEFSGETFTSKRGCYALAEEACRIVLAAKHKTEPSS